jgi:hypothetical protein
VDVYDNRQIIKLADEQQNWGGRSHIRLCIVVANWLLAIKRETVVWLFRTFELRILWAGYLCSLLLKSCLQCKIHQWSNSRSLGWVLIVFAIQWL